MSLLLHTPRLLLRPVRESDVPVLAGLLAEPEVARWWHGYDEERVRHELLMSEDCTVFAIEYEGRVIGAIQACEETDPDYRHAGMDLFLGTAWQGRGLGTEALHAVTRHLLVERGHHRLVIDPAADNVRALHAYERVGFRRVGVMRKYERSPTGHWHDGLLMELLAEEYLGAPAGAARPPPMALQTPRLLLRPLEPAHEQALFQLWNEPQVRRYLWDDKPVPREVVAEQVELSTRSFQQSGFGFYALFPREEPGRLMGFCGLRRIDDSPDVELLYGLHPDWWRQGLATEASRAVLRHGFEHAGLEEIFAGADAGNERSFHVMQRLGLRSRGERHVGPERLPALYASLRRQDFEADASAPEATR